MRRMGGLRTTNDFLSTHNNAYTLDFRAIFGVENLKTQGVPFGGSMN